jgi:hypothetical protein
MSLERAALLWAVYRNFTPAQWRSEHKRQYRCPGECALEVAGAPPGEISYLDALGVAAHPQPGLLCLYEAKADHREPLTREGWYATLRVAANTAQISPTHFAADTTRQGSPLALYCRAE